MFYVGVEITIRNTLQALLLFSTSNQTVCNSLRALLSFIGDLPQGGRAHTVSFHNFKLSVSNPKSKYVAYVSVLSRISNCQSLGRKNKHAILKTDRKGNLLCIPPFAVPPTNTNTDTNTITTTSNNHVCVGISVSISISISISISVSKTR